MATESQHARTTKQAKKHEAAGAASSEVVKTVEKDISPFQAFFTKFNNDWVMNFASGLAFNILTAIFPIAIAIIAISGLVIGRLNPGAQQQLINGINGLFQSPLSSNKQNILAPALLSLSKNAGLLGVISIILAIFGGSRLFVTLEGYFDVIYHVRQRNVIPQNIMALIMMLVFIVLIPAMIFSASGPALVSSLLQATPLSKIPYINLLFGLGGLLFGVLCAWIFFLIIYVAVPNQRISFRNSWLGALVAAVLVQLYLTLFPFYVTHFLNNYTGAAGAVGFAVILLFFLYYFAVILLLGAEINAFILEKIRATPANIPAIVHQYTSHLPTNEKDIQDQAATSHKGEEPKTILPKDQAQQLTTEAHEGTTATATAQKQTASPKQMAPSSQQEHTAHPSKHERKSSSSQKSSRLFAIIEAVTGTGLAFLVELFRLRRKK